MRLNSFYVSDYKCLTDFNCNFALNSIFPNGGQITGLIGSNGSGKTTTCSAIAKMLDMITSLKRYDFDFEISFTSRHGDFCFKNSRGLIECFKYGEKIHEYSAKRRNSYESKSSLTEFMKSVWNGKIILSTFETAGEYPTIKQGTTSNRDNVYKYDVSHIYGKNMYGFPSLTDGIMRYISDPAKDSLAKMAFKEMGINYTGKVQVRIVGRIIEQLEYITEKLSQYERFKMNNTYMYPNDEAFINFLESPESPLKLTSENQTIHTSSLMKVAEKCSFALGKLIYINGFVYEKNGIELTFDHLSAGEKFFIIRYLSILDAISEDSVVIVEEPENHLNPSWREIVIPLLHKVASTFNSSLIFTTHDYRAIRYLHQDNVFVLNNGRIEVANSPTLLCDEYDFEDLSGEIREIVYKEVRKEFIDSDDFKKSRLLNGIARVPERQDLRKLIENGQ